MLALILPVVFGAVALILVGYAYRYFSKRRIEKATLTEMLRIAPLLSGILLDIGRAIRAGVTTAELDADLERRLRAAGLEPAMKGYRGFTAASAISIDEEVMHAPPSARILREGELVKVQVAAKTSLAFAIFGWTYPVGTISEEKRHLMSVARQALDAGIQAARAGERIGDIGASIEGRAAEAGFSVARAFVGHGVGRALHQEPQIPCYGRSGTGLHLKPGVVLSLNAIVHAGSYQLEILEDGWTAATVDKKPAALFTAMLHIEADKSHLLASLPDAAGASEARK